MSICPNCFESGFAERCAKCGYLGLSHQESQMTLQVGMLLNNRYIVGRTLGAGGFGVTYLVKDRLSAQLLAAKEYFPTMFAVRDGDSKVVRPSGADSRDEYEHGLKVFDREAESLRLFLGNPSVVQVTDSFRQNGTSYYIMEFLDGVNLKALSRSMGGRLPIDIALDVLRNVGATLATVHEKGLLHRDVSPENIFVTKQGTVKLIDFGATRFFVGERSRSLSVVLKPGFAPPEQYSSKGNQGPWTDVYALAATFLSVVSGLNLPDSPDRLSGATLEAVFSSSGLESPTRSIIEKALDLNFRQRYQTVGEFFVGHLALQRGGGAVGVFDAATSIRWQGSTVGGQGSGVSGIRFVAILASASRARPRSTPPSPTPAPRSTPPPPAVPAQPTAPRNAAAPATPPPVAQYSIPSPPPPPPNLHLGMEIRSTPYVRLIQDGKSFDKWVLPVNMDMTIGRSTGRCNIIVDDSDVSRVHCTIRYDGNVGMFLLTDMSTNGTYLKDGTRLRKGVQQSLQPGTRFVMPGGKIEMEVGVE